MNTHRSSRVAFAALAALVSTGVVATTAHATQELQTDYEYEFSESFELCGYELERHEAGSGRVQFRTGRNAADSLFFVHNTSSFDAVITNPANGRYWTESFDGNYVDTRARRIAGNVFELSGVEAGRYVIRDAQGEVVIRERGRITTTFAFDTLGDDQIGGVGLGVIDVDVAGPHPLLDIDPVSLCAGVADLVG